MRFWLVFALAGMAWVGEHRWSWEGGAALCGAAVAGACLARSPSPGVRALAPLPPALFLLARAAAYAAAPTPTRVIFSAGLVGSTTLAVHLAASPLAASPWITRARAARILAGACLSAAVLAFAFVPLELLSRRIELRDPYGFRAVEGSASPQAYVPDPELGVVLSPGFRGRFQHPEYREERIEINAHGFRDREWPARSDPRTIGLLLLGDSSLFGLGVEREETIACLLEERLLEHHAPRSFRVYGGGVPGYGPRHELVVLRRVVERLEPQLCVVLFYDGNDLDDCRRQFLQAREAGLHSLRLGSEDMERAGTLRTPNLYSSRVKRGPPLWSRVYWGRYSSLYRTLDFEVASRLPGDWAPIRYVYNHEFLRAMRREPDLEIEEERELALQAIGAMAEECGRRGTAFALVRLPGSLQCARAGFQDALEELGLDPDLFDRREPGASLVEGARRRGIPVRDLLPVLEGEGKQSPFYFREGHPNRRGNRRIAEELLVFLEESRLLDAALSRATDD